MVRIKHRYLLVNVLYPEDASNHKQTDENLPWSVKFRRPSSDRFDGRLLFRMVRDGVSDLFGDYGAGMVAGSLQGIICIPISAHASKLTVYASQILLFSDEYGHHSSGEGSLSTRLGCALFHYSPTQTRGPTMCDSGCSRFRHHQEMRRRGNQACKIDHSSSTANQKQWWRCCSCCRNPRRR